MMLNPATIVLAILFVICLAAFLFGVYRRPYVLANSILLQLTIFFGIFVFLFLFWTDASVPIMIVGAVCVILFLLLAPVMLIWNGIVMMRRESGKLANILSLLLGLVIGLGEVALAVYVFSGATTLKASVKGVFLAFFGMSVAYFSVLMLSFVLYMLLLPLMRRTGRYDTLIIHGCALIHGNKVSRILAARLDTAISLYHANDGRTVLIPSGGQGDDETVTEASAMRGYLLEHGVSPDKILLEDKSRSTEENLRLSRKLMEEHGCGERMGLVTSNYHLYRCLLIAHDMGIRCHGFGGKVAAYYWPSAVIREFVAVYTRRFYLITALLGYVLTVILPLILLNI